MASPKPAKPKATTKKVYRERQRPNNSLSIARVEQALRASAGIQSYAARKLRVDKSTLSRFITNNPELRDVIAEVNDDLVDVAVVKLVGLIHDGDFPAIKYFLDNKGEPAGFGSVKRIQLTGRNGGPIQIRGASIDLSKLSKDELLQMEQMLSKVGFSDESDEASAD